MTMNEFYSALARGRGYFKLLPNGAIRIGQCCPIEFVGGDTIGLAVKRLRLSIANSKIIMWASDSAKSNIAEVKECRRRMLEILGLEEGGSHDRKNTH